MRINQSVSLKVLLRWKNCSSGRMLYILFVQKSTRPIIALNKKYEQTLNNKKIVKSLLSSRFDKTRDWKQSRNLRSIEELNKAFFRNSPEAEFPFNQCTVSTSVSDPELKINK